MQKKILVSLLSIFSFFQGSAQLRLASVFGDHMVLQREKPIKFWGGALPNTPIEVMFNGQTKTIRSNAAGKWSVELRAMDAGGPFMLEVSSKREKISLNDIYIGEVWLCSGQSNMEWSVNASDNAAAEIRQANYPLIRHFSVAKDIQLAPQDELPTHEKSKDAGWKVCSSETIGDFTAVGYFFARDVQRELGKDVAIGILHSSWGGSQVEGWISEEGMAKSEVLGYYAKQIPRTWESADQQLERRILRHCFGTDTIKPTAADEATYLLPGYDYSKWPVGSAPGSWDWQEIWAYRGYGYMARDLQINPEIADSAALLFLGENDHDVSVFINGQLIKKTQQKGVIRVNIPAGTFRAGKNSLMLKIGSQNDSTWWEMGLHGDWKQIRLEIAGSTIQLSGTDAWFNMPAWGEPHRYLHLQNNVGASIYNSMIHPIISFPIRGALWYQGESNASRAYQYRASFPLLIEDWRRLWNDPFPFLFVQLSSYGSNKSSNGDSKWPELREAQAITLRLPNTGMVVTTDIGNADDIHPKNKQDVGKRLAAYALFTVYNKTLPYRSPQVLDVVFEAASAVISFDYTEGGLVAKDKFGYVRGFEVAGEDKVFYYAQAQIVNGNQIIVVHPKGQKPVAIRYAWSDAPTDANVFNGVGFPLGTFRTDDWPCVTQGKKFE